MIRADDTLDVIVIRAEQAHNDVARVIGPALTKLAARHFSGVSSPPMPSLHDTIDALAADFAHNLLQALRGASLEDIIAETSVDHVRRRPGRPRAQVAGGGDEAPAPSRAKRKAGRLARRSTQDIARTLDQVVALVKTKKSGLRSEEIRAALKLDKREVPRVLQEGLKTKKLKAKGQKRATTYFSGGPQSPSKAKAKKTTRRAKKAKKHVVARARRAPAKKAANAKQQSTPTTNGAAQPVTTATSEAS